MNHGDIKRELIPSFDGQHLAVHRMGAGRPIVLLHGLFSNADMNWVRFGHAACLAQSGFEVIMPDLRAHGKSASPHDPAAYPQGVLVQDAIALVGQLGLGDYDLAGFSLGARTAAGAVIAGLAPRRLVLAGMGLSGILGWGNRLAFFVDAIDRFDDVKRGDPAFMAVSFMKTMQVDRVAARLLLQSVEGLKAESLSAIMMPTLVLCGAEDRDNGSPEDLVAALPDAHLATIAGTHMSSVAQAGLGEAMKEFLLAP